MSTKIKFYTVLFCLAMSKISMGQETLELTNRVSIGGAPSQGPTTSAIGPIAFEKDLNTPSNNKFFDGVLPLSQQLSVTFSLANQTYTGLTYSNVSTGLVFGASPTTAIDPSFPATQKVDPNDTYNLLASFSAAVGGPTNDMFTAGPNSTPTVQSGTGIIGDGNFAPPANAANNAVGVFTAAQVLFDQPGGPAVHNSATRYYYGDVVINFSKYVNNPVIHIAGLGGSYRYFPVSGTNVNDPAQWRSSFFTTELEVLPGFALTRMSGNQFFTVAGNSITNSSATPNGASVNTVGGLFQDLGAASGSFKINGPVRTVTLRVYLRGSTASNFPWSTTQATVAGANRNPFTGDIWWISASAEPSTLISLPSTGVTLAAALNGNDVSLNWKTLTEVNSKSFEIERSTDGVNYVKIAEKVAAGNSTTDINYSYLDPNMTAKTYYYRLRMVDIDNKFTYTNIAIVRKSSVKSIRVFPNPVTDYMNIEFSNAKGAYTVSLFNQAGQEVQSRKADINSTVQYVRIEKGSLLTGMYYVRITNTSTGEVFNEKLIVK
jgi:Secretion system C-terminal sorting domain